MLHSLFTLVFGNIQVTNNIKEKLHTISTLHTKTNNHTYIKPKKIYNNNINNFIQIEKLKNLKNYFKLENSLYIGTQ